MRCVIVLKIRIFGSWYQRSEQYRLTWYRNTSRGVAKESDHILVSTRWKILQNCWVYHNAEVFATDHRFVIGTLRLHIRF